MKKHILTLFATAAVISTATMASANTEGCDDGEMVIKFSHVTNTDKHPKGLAASLLQERINAEMDGKACMEVYPNSTLYDDDAVLEAMLQGDVHLAAPSLSKFEKYTLAFRIFDLPFMFKSTSVVDEFQLGEKGQAMLISMENRGLSGLGFWHNGLKQFSANKPLIAPTDAAGLKFRVQTSDVLVAQMEALNASAQPMSFSEVYGALQTGVVDGQENTWSNNYGQKYQEVQDGFTETNHGVLDYLVVTSTEWLDGLDADVREQFITIFNDVTAERNGAVGEVTEQARQSILDSGGTIRELTDEQRQAWVDVMKPVWEQFAGDVGQENIDFIQDLNSK